MRGLLGNRAPCIMRSLQSGPLVLGMREGLLDVDAHSRRSDGRYLVRDLYRPARLHQRLQHSLLLVLLLPLSHALRTPLRTSGCTLVAPPAGGWARRSCPRPSQATLRFSLALSPACPNGYPRGRRRQPPEPALSARSPRRREPAPSL